MKHSEQINEIASALSKMQGELEDATKANSGYGYKYADLSQLLSIVRPLLSKNGLCVVQPVRYEEERVIITTLVMHSSGQWLSSELGLAISGTKGMNTAQQVGSTITYGRRYSLASVLAVHSEDDSSAIKPQQFPQDDRYSKPPTESPLPKLIEGSQVVSLSELINEAKVDLATFCKQYGINHLSMLPFDKYANAVNRLQATIDKNKSGDEKLKADFKPEEYLNA